MAKYGITGKLVQSGELLGFFVVDDTGKVMLLSKNRTIQLAENRLITNWEVVTDESAEKHLYSDSVHLKDIPNDTKGFDYGVKVVGRLEQSGETTGYICMDPDQVRHSLTVDKLWQLARLGRVTDVDALRYNNNRVLQSSTIKLTKLPLIKT